MSKAREFWKAMLQEVIAAQTDEHLAQMAELFTARRGEVLILELVNHSKPNGSRGTVNVKTSCNLAILDRTVLDQISPPKKSSKKTGGRKS